MIIILVCYSNFIRERQKWLVSQTSTRYLEIIVHRDISEQYMTSIHSVMMENSFTSNLSGKHFHYICKLFDLNNEYWLARIVSNNLLCYEYRDIRIYGFINNNMDDIILILYDCRINDTIYVTQVYIKKHITICLSVKLRIVW